MIFFWKKCELFVNHSSEKFLKFSESRNFLLPAIKNAGKLAVLLLFSNFFVRFLEFCTISNFFRKFSEIFRFFSEIFQKFLKIFWIFSEIFLKIFWIQKFPAASYQKCRKTSCFASIFKLFRSFSLNFAPFQNFFRKFSETPGSTGRISEILSRKFSEIFQKLIKLIQYLSRLGRKSQN